MIRQRRRHAAIESFDLDNSPAEGGLGDTRRAKSILITRRRLWRGVCPLFRALRCLNVFDSLRPFFFNSKHKYFDPK